LIGCSRKKKADTHNSQRTLYRAENESSSNKE